MNDRHSYECSTGERCTAVNRSDCDHACMRRVQSKSSDEIQDDAAIWLAGFNRGRQAVIQKPLTGERLNEILASPGLSDSARELYLQFARQVEAAHGIK